MTPLTKWTSPAGAVVIFAATVMNEELLHVPVPDHLQIEVEADTAIFRQQVLSVASTSESAMLVSATSTDGQKVYLTVGYLPKS